MHNGSSRPIRNVAARLEPAPGTGYVPAAAVITPKFRRVSNSDKPVQAGFDHAAAADMAVLRAGLTCGFSFAYPAREYPEARHVARFTDDAGLHWQIDQELHLERLDERDW